MKRKSVVALFLTMLMVFTLCTPTVFAAQTDTSVTAQEKSDLLPSEQVRQPAAAEKCGQAASRGAEKAEDIKDASAVDTATKEVVDELVPQPATAENYGQAANKGAEKTEGMKDAAFTDTATKEIAAEKAYQPASSDEHGQAVSMGAEKAGGTKDAAFAGTAVKEAADEKVQAESATKEGPVKKGNDEVKENAKAEPQEDAKKAMETAAKEEPEKSTEADLEKDSAAEEEVAVGSLMVSCQIDGATDLLLKNSGTVYVKFTGTEFGEEFDAQILDANDKVVLTFKAKNNSNIALGYSEKLKIDGIPENTRYTVAALFPNYVDIYQIQGSTGTIKADETSEALIFAEYAAYGKAQIVATVEDEDGSVERYEHEFYLRAENGDVVKTALSLEDGSVNFGNIWFSNWECDKPVLMYMDQAYDFDNYNKGQDDSAFFVVITPNDDGEGNVICDVKYYNAEEATETAEIVYCPDCDGTGDSALGLDCESCDGTGVVSFELKDGEVDAAVFHNALPEEQAQDVEYGATNQVVFTARSELYGVEPKEDDGAVIFVYQLNGSHLEGVAVEVGDFGEDVVFNPLQYTKEDVGDTYYYVIKQAPSDTDEYTADRTAFGYEVDVTENEYGQVVASASPVDATGVTTECKFCNGEGTIEKASYDVKPIFRTDFESYCDISFKGLPDISEFEYDSLVGIYGTEDSWAIIPMVKTEEGGSAWQDGLRYQFGRENLPFGQRFIVLAYADDVMFSLDFQVPSAEEMANKENFAVTGKDTYMMREPIKMSRTEECEHCLGVGVAVNEDWVPTPGIDPLFINGVGKEFDEALRLRNKAMQKDHVVVAQVEIPSLDKEPEDAAEEQPAKVRTNGVSDGHVKVDDKIEINPLETVAVEGSDALIDKVANSGNNVDEVQNPAEEDVKVEEAPAEKAEAEPQPWHGDDFTIE